MLALAIDSSGDTCALALGDGSELLAEYHFRHRMDLLRRIVPNINRLLSDCAKDVRDLDGVVVSVGPGSFTGLRIGVTVAKTLAYVLGKRIVGVGTLDAMARAAAVQPAEEHQTTGDDVICPMIFARANEVYWSIFDASGTGRLAECAVSTVDEALSAIERMGGRARFVGAGARRNWEAISSRLGGSASLCDRWADFARGAALLELGLARLNAGDADDALALAPLYIRKPTPVLRLESGRLDA